LTTGFTSSGRNEPTSYPSGLGVPKPRGIIEAMPRKERPLDPYRRVRKPVPPPQRVERDRRREIEEREARREAEEEERRSR
jgi:hypothetical protein